MSEINPNLNNHRRKTACLFPDEGFFEVVLKMVESKKDKKWLRLNSRKIYSFNQRHDCVHHVWCLHDDPVEFPAWPLGFPRLGSLGSCPANTLQLPSSKAIFPFFKTYVGVSTYYYQGPINVWTIKQTSVPFCLTVPVESLESILTTYMVLVPYCQRLRRTPSCSVLQNIILDCLKGP